MVTKKQKIILEIEDKSIGEDLRNNVMFIPNRDALLIKDINNKLYLNTILPQSNIEVDSNLVNVLHANSNEIYYTKKDTFICYNIITQKKLDIFSGENIKISFAGKYNDDIVVCLNDNLMLYNDNGKIKRLDNLRKGDYKYLKNGIAIEELVNAIYLHKLEDSN